MTTEPKVVHVMKEKCDVYVGRPSKWGNPYSTNMNSLAIHKTATVEESIEKYHEYLLASPLMADLHELKGKTLGCWCAPGNCHANILMELANGS